MKRVLATLIIAILASVSAFIIADTGALNMTTKTAYTTKEPLLIAGEQKNYSILPAGTVLYFDRAWPEGHQTYHVYFHFKGDFNSEPADATMISPLWLRTVDPEELPKLLKDYPITKDELVEILKARKITKAELVQIVREWPDE
jgi:hypothetical protein